MESLYKKTPKVQSENIQALFVAGISTNKEELVVVNGFGEIDSNDEAENIVYFVCFTSVPYDLQVTV